jgi:hypothetical protein
LQNGARVWKYKSEVPPGSRDYGDHADKTAVNGISAYPSGCEAGRVFSFSPKQKKPGVDSVWEIYERSDGRSMAVGAK